MYKEPKLWFHKVRQSKRSLQHSDSTYRKTDAACHLHPDTFCLCQRCDDPKSSCWCDQTMTGSASDQLTDWLPAHPVKIECQSPSLLLPVHRTLYDSNQQKETNCFLIPFKLYLQSQMSCLSNTLRSINVFLLLLLLLLLFTGAHAPYFQYVFDTKITLSANLSLKIILLGK